ncbi:MAG: hypothetical protein H0T42_24890, partial [Deltaproteobacteria bacterium]|nr:hypothetical protein [Deltaproteobacteria bacterium]
GSAGLRAVSDETPENQEDPDLAWDVTEIDRREFAPRTLAKLSKGVEYGRQLVVVGGQPGDLWIDGIARRSPSTDGGNVLRVAAPHPGALVVEYGERELLRFDAGKRRASPLDVFGEQGPVRSKLDSIRKINAVVQPDFSFVESILRQLISRMRATGAGAILAMLGREPTDDELTAVKYHRVNHNILADNFVEEHRLRTAWRGERMAFVDKVQLTKDELYARDHARESRERSRRALQSAIEDVARMSAIDGAVLAGPSLNIYGAGYLVASKSVAQIDVVLAADVHGRDLQPMPSLTAARHKAAYTFAFDNPDGIAFVVSEDGPVRCAMRDGERVIVWPVRVPET